MIENITPCGEVTLEQLQDYIATCSSVVRDKQPKSAEKLFKRLLTESVGDKASRVLEFIPVTLTAQWVLSILEMREDMQFFGFFKNGKYYTNAREYLNWGADMSDVLSAIDFTHYKVFKCETPYFIYGQVSTHNQLTTVSHSQRMGKCDRGYWIPEEIIKWHKNNNLDNIQEWWDDLVESYSPTELKNYMQTVGIVRKEVWDRGADMLQNRVFTIGGYTNNPYAWEHFIKQRTDNHTQLETREFVKLLK